MAKLTKYVVVHSVRHDGKPYPPGSHIELNETDALRLLDFGSITQGNVIVVQAPPVFAPLSPATLAKLNVAELVAHGNTAYGLSLTEDLKREAISEAIQTAVSSRQAESTNLDSFTSIVEGAGLGARV